MVYSYNGILFGNENERQRATCNSMINPKLAGSGKEYRSGMCIVLHSWLMALPSCRIWSELWIKPSLEPCKFHSWLPAGADVRAQGQGFFMP